MRFQPIPPDQFVKYKETLSGLNSDNANQVQQKMVELGLSPAAGVGLPGDKGDVHMKNDPELKRLRSAAVGVLGADEGDKYAELVAQLGTLGATAVVPGPNDPPPTPAWAKGLIDARHHLRFDATQYVCPVAANGRLILTIVDTGAHRTVIDTAMARVLGLNVSQEAGDYGRFSVPGSDAIHRYAGVIEGDTTL